MGLRSGPIFTQDLFRCIEQEAGMTRPTAPGPEGRSSVPSPRSDWRHLKFTETCSVPMLRDVWSEKAPSYSARRLMPVLTAARSRPAPTRP